MTDSQSVLAIMALVTLTGAAVIWSNSSLHGGWTEVSLFYATGLTISGFLSFAGVIYKDWRGSDA